MTFMFENLDVYKKAIDFVDNLYSLCDNLNKIGLAKIVDQLRRASLSIPLNIAEGCGRFHKKERKQFYKMSRGSLHECVPLLEILLRRKQLSKEWNKFQESKRKNWGYLGDLNHVSNLLKDVKDYLK